MTAKVCPLRVVRFAGCVAALLLAANPVHAETITFDFNDDLVTPLVNGMIVDSPSAFGNVFNLASSGPNLGATIFDSNPLGPNAASVDQDLLVNTGNVLILQQAGNGQSTVPGIFDAPDDDRDGGVITIDFLPSFFPVQVDAIDVIDVDTENSMTITLTDSAGRMRVVDIPEEYTGDITEGQIGIATINLFAGVNQLSPNQAGLFTDVMTDAGFDPSDVTGLAVQINGSGGLDNLSFVPEPSTTVLLVVALFMMTPRRRLTRAVIANSTR